MNLSGHAYIAKNGEGFTTFPDLAQTVSVLGEDLPVLAPGITGWVRQRHLRNTSRIWSALLDAMEWQYEGLESPPDRPDVSLNGHIDGLEHALAILFHGVADEGALKLVRAEASVRYEADT